MKTLQDIQYLNEIAKIERGINFLESEYNELLNYSVNLNEYAYDAENVLNSILSDCERRIEAARSGLSAAGRLKDPAERKAHVARMMAHLNRTRSLLNKVVKEFYPVKGEDGVHTGSDEYLSPKQAAETLGVSTSQLQSLVMSNKLRMYNDNGRWALKGSEVQAVLDAGPKKQAAPVEPGKRADFSKFVK